MWFFELLVEVSPGLRGGIVSAGFSKSSDFALVCRRMSGGGDLGRQASREVPAA
jgi:hypothetical protein